MPHRHREHPHHEGQEAARTGATNPARQSPPTQPQEYPEAQPSFLQTKFSGPVLGTVIIGRELPESIDDDDIFELVAPDGTVLNRNHATARNMLRNIEASLNQMSATPSFQSSGSASVPATGQTPPPSPVDPNAPALPSEKHILNEGGFVVFSDLYVAAHPSSPIAAISHDYNRAYHADAQRETFTVDATLPAEKQRLEKIKYILKEADAYHRPLFRRRPSRLRYGTAYYLPAEPATTRLTSAQSCGAISGMRRGGDSFASSNSIGSADTSSTRLPRTATTETFPLPQTATRKVSTITIADSITAGTAY